MHIAKFQPKVKVNPSAPPGMFLEHDRKFPEAVVCLRRCNQAIE
jgi:hypothetical protein